MKVKSDHHRYHWKIYCNDNSSLSSIIVINLFAFLFRVWLVIFLLFFCRAFYSSYSLYYSYFFLFSFFFLKKNSPQYLLRLQNVKEALVTLIFHQQTQMPRKLRYCRCAYGRVRDSQSPELYMNT